jgi:opacity protein-like surface antigen
MRHTALAVIIAAFALACSQIASAADLSVKAPSPVVPVSEWTGFYVGANVGGAWSHDNATISFPDALSVLDPLRINTGRSAAIGGFQEGFNWQIGPSVVWGLEADWSFTSAGRTVSQPLTFGGGMPTMFTQRYLGHKTGLVRICAQSTWFPRYS